MRLQTGALSAVLWLAFTGLASAADPAPAKKEEKKPDVPGVSTSSNTVGSIYTVERLRDPFMRGGAAPVAKISSSSENEAQDFSIHALGLRGILKDPQAEYAVLSNGVGSAYILRKGKLFDHKGKAVPGVSGTINVKTKTVNLITSDKDVQVYRLGEKDDEEQN
jgi:hypothetical protein